jgi:hypothetical protein
VVAHFPDYAQHAQMIQKTLTAHPEMGDEITRQLVSRSPAMMKIENETLTAAGQSQRGQAEMRNAARQEERADLQEASARLAGAPPPNKEAYKAIVDKLPHATAQKILDAVSYEDYNPKTSPNRLRAIGATSAQQMTADGKGAAGPNTEAEFAATATDPTKTPEQRAAAEAALKRLDQSKLASRPVNTFNVAMPGVSMAPSTVHGDDYLKTLPPSFAARVKNVAMGGEKPPTGQAANRGMGAQLINAVYQYDPDYTPMLAQQRSETLKEFTSTSVSKAGGQALALNTLIHHADLWMRTAESLKNGTFKPGNSAYNAVADAFGAAPPTQANLVARFFAGETSKVATGGVPAEGEINGILKSLGNNAGPEQIAGAGKSLLQVASGRMIPLQERVNDAKLQKLVHVLGPDARDILTRRGFDPETMKPGKGGSSGSGTGGSVPTVNTKAEYDALAKGALYIDKQDGKQYQKR